MIVILPYRAVIITYLEFKYSSAVTHRFKDSFSNQYSLMSRAWHFLMKIQVHNHEVKRADKLARQTRGIGRDQRVEIEYRDLHENCRSCMPCINNFLSPVNPHIILQRIRRRVKRNLKDQAIYSMIPTHIKRLVNWFQSEIFFLTIQAWRKLTQISEE